MYLLLYLPADSLSLGPDNGPKYHTHIFISINTFSELILIWNKPDSGRKSRGGGEGGRRRRRIGIR
jgi:hypothetical protein